MTSAAILLLLCSLLAQAIDAYYQDPSDIAPLKRYKLENAPDNPLVLDFEKTYSFEELQAMTKAQKAAAEVKQESSVTSPSAEPTSLDANHVALKSSSAHSIEKRLPDITEFVHAEFLFSCTKLGLTSRTIKFTIRYRRGLITYLPVHNVETFEEQHWQPRNGRLDSIFQHKFCLAFEDSLCVYKVRGYFDGELDFLRRRIPVTLAFGEHEHGSETEVEEECFYVTHAGNTCAETRGVVRYTSCHLYNAYLVPRGKLQVE